VNLKECASSLEGNFHPIHVNFKILCQQLLVTRRIFWKYLCNEISVKSQILDLTAVNETSASKEKINRPNLEDLNLSEFELHSRV